jgi:hypothetical protein
VGDTEDLATLLVALQRQAGVRAELALIGERPRDDLDPDLPVPAQFDRPRARAARGTRGVDRPSKPLARVGQLPDSRQGRRALLLADDSKSLSTAPATAGKDSVYRESVTIVAAASGASRLTKLLRVPDGLEPDNRAIYRDTPVTEMTRDLTRHVASIHLANLQGYTTTEPGDPNMISWVDGQVV